MAKSLRCKLRVVQVSRTGGVDKDTSELYEIHTERLLLEPAGEDHDFVPPAQFIVQVDDRALVGPVEVGSEFYLSLSPVKE